MRSTNNATISLGRPITSPVLIPVIHNSTPKCISEPFMVDGEPYKVTCVSFGTPHGAVLVDNVDSVDVPSIGSSLGTHALFPKGASIVFVEVIDSDNLKARIWQQGEGEVEFTTEAACVAATAAMMLQKIMKNETNVALGSLAFHVKWDRGSDNVYLTGSSDLMQA